MTDLSATATKDLVTSSSHPSLATSIEKTAPVDICLRIQNPLCKEPWERNLTTDLTVTQLKLYLSKNYPGQPQVAHMRLVFSGRLLLDSEKLSDLLFAQNQQIQSQQAVLTLHLVLSHQSVVKEKQEMNQEGAKSVVSIGGKLYTIELPAQFKDAFQPRAEAPVAPIAEAAAAQQAPPPEFQDEQAEIQNPIFTLLRLAFIFSLLAQNGSTPRTVFLGIACVVIALSQFGYLRWTLFTDYFANRRQGNQENQEQVPLVEQEPEQAENESLWKSILTMSINFIASLVPGLQDQGPAVL